MRKLYSSVSSAFRGCSYILVATLLLASCSKDSAPRVADHSDTHSPIDSSQLIAFPIQGELSLDLAEGSALRALDATISPSLNAKGQHAVTLPNTVPVITIIRSSGNDPVTYITGLNAVKDASTGRYKVEKD